MDADTTFSNYPEDLLHPYFSSIILFLGTSGDETAICDRENKGVKEFKILLIKRAVNEDIDVVILGGGSGRPWHFLALFHTAVRDSTILFFD